jgi:hypothetical protein
MITKKRKQNGKDSVVFVQMSAIKFLRISFQLHVLRKKSLKVLDIRERWHSLLKSTGFLSAPFALSLMDSVHPGT